MQHRDRRWRRPLAIAVLAAASAPGIAQEAGWHFSPLPGEGDRAALGCALDSDATAYTCLAVRCEDDMSVGLHIHTSRTQGDAGDWFLTIDKERQAVTTLAPQPGDPYGSRIAGDVAAVVEDLQQGATAYLDPVSGEGLTRNSISLSGSLLAINRALYFCAASEPQPDPPVPAQSNLWQRSTLEALCGARRICDG